MVEILTTDNKKTYEDCDKAQAERHFLKANSTQQSDADDADDAKDGKPGSRRGGKGRGRNRGNGKPKRTPLPSLELPRSAIDAMSSEEYTGFQEARREYQRSVYSTVQSQFDSRNSPEPTNNDSVSQPTQEFSSRLASLTGETQGGHPANPYRTSNAGRRLQIDAAATTKFSGHIQADLGPHETIMIVDSGTDSTVVGKNCVVLATTERSARLVGFKDDLVADALPIVTAAFAFDPADGNPIILEVNEAVYIHGNTTSLLSPTQAREFGVAIDDIPTRYGGKQHILVDGYTIPLNFHNALLHLRLRKPTVYELEHCDHVILTGDQIWDPSALKDDKTGRIISPFNVKYIGKIGSDIDSCEGITETMIALRSAYAGARSDPIALVPSEYRARLGWMPVDTIQRTFEATTQLAKHVPLRIPLRRHHKSRFPYLNRKRLPETVATDTYFSKEKAYGGYTCVQLFVGTTSQFIQVYGLQRESLGVQALEDFIRDIGAPHDIRSDNAKMEIGIAWTQLCRKYNIAQSTTEPEHPQQNPAERAIQDIKKMSTKLMDRENVPTVLWYLCCKYVAYLRNRTASEQLGWRTPFEKLYGITPDISCLMQFAFYERVMSR